MQNRRHLRGYPRASGRVNSLVTLHCTRRSATCAVCMAALCGFVSFIAGMATIVCRLIAVLACTDPIALGLKPVQGTVLAVGGSIITPAHGLA